MDSVSMSYGELCRRQIRVGDRVIQLSPQEHNLAVALLGYHPERWVPARELRESLWGYTVPDNWLKTIHVYCYNLRIKGIPVEGRRGRGNGGLRINRRGRSQLGH